MKNRIYYMDAIRGILMIFIVFIHATQVFNPEKVWAIYSEKSLSFAPFFIEFLLLFTLTTFYILSGYFAAMTIEKVGRKVFLNVRIKRIVIPVIVTALTLNSLQAIILETAGWKHYETISNYLQSGGWISHLWFLIDLIIFFILLYIFYGVSPYRYKKIKKIIPDYNIIYILFGVSIITFLSVSISSIFAKYWYFGNFIYLQALALYLVFFIFGTMLYHSKKLLNKILDLPYLIAFMIIIFSIIGTYYFDKPTNIYTKSFLYFFDINAKVFATVLFISICYRFLNKKNRLLDKLSDASYTVYLFHHLLIIVIGLILIKYKISAIIGWFILIITVVTLSLGIHFLFISKSNLLSYLYNGKLLKKDATLNNKEKKKNV